MTSNSKNAERREYLRNSCDKILTDLLSQLAFHRPPNVVQFLYDYSEKKLQETNNNNTAVTEAVPQDIRKSVPKLVYAEENEVKENGESHQADKKSELEQNVNTEMNKTQDLQAQQEDVKLESSKNVVKASHKTIEVKFESVHQPEMAESVGEKPVTIDEVNNNNGPDTPRVINN